MLLIEIRSLYQRYDKKEVLKEQRVPILSSIPLIGKAFQSLEKSYENTELIIMLIPRII